MESRWCTSSAHRRPKSEHLSDGRALQIIHTFPASKAYFPVTTWKTKQLWKCRIYSFLPISKVYCLWGSVLSLFTCHSEGPSKPRRQLFSVVVSQLHAPNSDDLTDKTDFLPLQILTAKILYSNHKHTSSHYTALKRRTKECFWKERIEISCRLSADVPRSSVLLTLCSLFLL